jgi:hypothetical protein
MPSATHASSGLARAELLFLLAVLLVGISLATPVWIEWRNHQFARETYRELRIMLSAADQFHREYRLWPAPDGAGRHDIRFGLGRENGDVVRTLAGVEGAGNEGHRANPQRIDFFALTGTPDFGAVLRRDARGNVLDPWGSPYQMVFDVNYDNICSIPESSYAAVVGEGVVMWSMGPDRRPDTGDDLRSWVIENAR